MEIERRLLEQQNVNNVKIKKVFNLSFIAIMSMMFREMLMQSDKRFVLLLKLPNWDYC